MVLQHWPVLEEAADDFLPGIRHHHPPGPHRDPRRTIWAKDRLVTDGRHADRGAMASGAGPRSGVKGECVDAVAGHAQGLEQCAQVVAFGGGDPLSTHPQCADQPEHGLLPLPGRAGPGDAVEGARIEPVGVPARQLPHRLGQITTAHLRPGPCRGLGFAVAGLSARNHAHYPQRIQ